MHGNFQINQSVYTCNGFVYEFLVKCIELRNNLLRIRFGYLLLVLRLIHTCLLVRVSHIDILTPLLLHLWLGTVLRCDLLLAPGRLLSWDNRLRLHRWRTHIDYGNELADRCVQVWLHRVPVLEIGDCNHVLLSDVVKFLDNFEGELFVVVDAWGCKRIVAGNYNFNRVVLHHVILNVPLQNDKVVLRFTGKFYHLVR